MNAVQLRIDHVAVELADEMRAGEVEETMRKALELLALRLAGAPLGAAEEAPRRALELVELELVAPDWLGGPAAAARLADELYERIVRTVA